MDMLGRKHPMIADFVANLREAFGDATIDEAVARGKAGEPNFFERSARGLLTISTCGSPTVACATGIIATDATAHVSGRVCAAASEGDWAAPRG
ncbi:hypothetical protein PQR08_29715 [Caballeronia jiangsuensis]|uniref:Uncharacterized protein n=1 Tax=Caballeronia jiangsuensis TaxID=1458357 RepID=A0ABW9CU79_9BURK